MTHDEGLITRRLTKIMFTVSDVVYSAHAQWGSAVANSYGPSVALQEFYVKNNTLSTNDLSYHDPFAFQAVIGWLVGW